MKSEYELVRLEIWQFEDSDVILTSGADGDFGGDSPNSDENGWAG